MGIVRDLHNKTLPRSRLGPVFEEQSRHLLEVPKVSSQQDRSRGQRDAGDSQIENSNR